MAEGGECDLVVSGNVEAKPTETQVASGRSPAIQNDPTVSLPDLVDDLIRRHADLESTKTLLLVLVWNFDLVPLLTISDDCAVEIIVIHLEEDVVVDIGTIEHPLQAMSLGELAEKTNVPEVGERLYITKSPPLRTKEPFSCFQPARSSHFNMPSGARDKSKFLD